MKFSMRLSEHVLESSPITFAAEFCILLEFYPPNFREGILKVSTNPMHVDKIPDGVLSSGKKHEKTTIIYIYIYPLYFQVKYTAMDAV